MTVLSPMENKYLSFKKTALTACLTLFFTHSFAEDKVTKTLERESKNPEKLNSLPLFIGKHKRNHPAQHTLSLHFRNAYFNRHFSHPNASHLKNPNWHQWAQGVIADFQSDYFKDFLGIDASLYSALKLDGINSQGAGGNQLLHTQYHGKVYSITYGKVGTLNLKAKLYHDSAGQTIIKAGLIQAESALTHDCNARLFPATYQGASLKTQLDDFTLYGYYLNRIGFPSGNSYDKFINGQGQTINALYIGGASYTAQHLDQHDSSLYLNTELGKSTDYLKGYFGQLTYHRPLSTNSYWMANLQYRYSEKAGDKWDAGKRPPGSGWCWRCLPASKASSLTNNTGAGWFDHNAQNINLNIKTQLSQLTLAASYTHTQAKSSGAGANSHKYHYALVGNDCGMGTFWTSRQVSNFNYDSENVWQGMMSYTFTQALKGLSASITHTYGSHINKAVGLKNEQETDITLRYDVQHPVLKGLSFAVDNAYYVSRERSGNPYGTRGYRLNDLRAYAMYTVKVF